MKTLLHKLMQLNCYIEQTMIIWWLWPRFLYNEKQE